MGRVRVAIGAEEESEGEGRWSGAYGNRVAAVEARLRWLPAGHPIPCGHARAAAAVAVRGPGNVPLWGLAGSTLIVIPCPERLPAACAFSRASLQPAACEESQPRRRRPRSTVHTAASIGEHTWGSTPGPCCPS